MHFENDFQLRKFCSLNIHNVNDTVSVEVYQGRAFVQALPVVIQLKLLHDRPESLCYFISYRSTFYRRLHVDNYGVLLVIADIDINIRGNIG